MFHRTRTWCVTDVETAEELATKLTAMDWTCCTGFKHAGLLFLNDASSGDGAQEYAVIRDGRQIESVTFGWMSEARALETIRALASASAGVDMGEFSPHVESLEEHGRCRHCA